MFFLKTPKSYVLPTLSILCPGHVNCREGIKYHHCPFIMEANAMNSDLGPYCLQYSRPLVRSV